ncbi:MAG: MerR family transcriptional regulator [Pseudolysinimonas sp.]
MTNTDAGMSISDMAAETGLSTSTLRYYEQEGLLLAQPDRASGGRPVRGYVIGQPLVRGIRRTDIGFSLSADVMLAPMSVVGHSMWTV